MELPSNNYSDFLDKSFNELKHEMGKTLNVRHPETVWISSKEFWDKWNEVLPPINEQLPNK